MTDIEMILGLSMIDVWLMACILCAGIGVLCALLFVALFLWEQIKGEGGVNVRSK